MASVAESTRSRVFAIAIGSVILAAAVGIAHVLWTRSAESEIVHYSWPVKWALTFASESPSLPTGSRFTTASVSNAQQGERWTVTGQVELPSSEGSRIVTSYSATVSSHCPNLSERHCWAMDRLSLGSVPVAQPMPDMETAALERDAALAAAPTPAVSDQPGPDALLLELEIEAEQEEDLAFILTEPLVEPADDLIAVLGGWSKIGTRQASGPRYDPVLVRDIQAGLTQLGYDPGPSDGVPGPRTRAAIQSFRDREHLASAPIGFELLEQIQRRLPGENEAPARAEPPAAVEDAQTGAKARRCLTINPKDRDCGA